MNPWKLTAIAMGVVMATALVTGLVVANWTAGDRATQEQKAQQKVVQATPARVASMPAAPSQSAIAACNKYAASEAGSKDKTMEVVKDGAIGAVVGAAGGGGRGSPRPPRLSRKFARPAVPWGREHIRRSLTMTNTRFMAAALALAASIGWMAAPTMAADDSKVKSATRQVETGARKIGDGKLGDGVEETAKGVGHTVVEGAKFNGEKLKESGQAGSAPAQIRVAPL